MQSWEGEHEPVLELRRRGSVACFAVFPTSARVHVVPYRVLCALGRVGVCPKRPKLWHGKSTTVTMGMVRGTGGVVSLPRAAVGHS